MIGVNTNKAVVADSPDRKVHVSRPVTPAAIGEALGIAPFEIIKSLILLEVFVAPTQLIEDEVAYEVGKRLGVTIVIDDGDDGGSSVKRVRPTGPGPLLPRRDRVMLAKLLEDLEEDDG